MTVTELLVQFANPDIVQTLPFADKLWAGLITTILGMGITFIALIILQFMISWMEKILNYTKEKAPDVKVTAAMIDEPPEHTVEADQDELVAVIASVIAMKMKTSVGNIVIRNIEKLDDRSPAWNKAGLIEQMNNRF